MSQPIPADLIRGSVPASLAPWAVEVVRAVESATVAYDRAYVSNQGKLIGHSEGVKRHAAEALVRAGILAQPVPSVFTLANRFNAGEVTI